MGGHGGLLAAGAGGRPGTGDLARAAPSGSVQVSSPAQLAQGCGRATPPSLAWPPAGVPGPSAVEVATFSPVAGAAALPGEGVAFRVARGWAADNEALRLPSCGPSLVPQRGLAPADHLALALRAAATVHPLSDPPCVAEGSAVAIAAQLALGPSVAALRVRRVALAMEWVKETAAEQAKLAEQGDPALRHFAQKPTFVLLRILSIIGSPARQFLERLHGGLPDVGQAAKSGIFPEVHQQPPAMDLRDLLAAAPQRNLELVQRMRQHHPHARELWEQGAAAERSGALGPPTALRAWADCHSVVFCRKFPVLQSKPIGDELAEPVTLQTEVRACVDASASPAGSAFNLAWAPAERIVCSDADVITAQMVASQLAFESPPEGCKDDLRKAYHQVGRCRDAVRVVQLFWDPIAKEVIGREQWAQDFGGSGSVTNCNVVFRCLRDIACRWLFVNMDNYSDDFWAREPAWSAPSARFAVRKLFAVLGYNFHEDKRREGCGSLWSAWCLSPRRMGPSCRTSLVAKSLLLMS